MNGKGSTRRPVDEQKFAKNYEQIFNKDKYHCESCGNWVTIENSVTLEDCDLCKQCYFGLFQEEDK
jgi:formylmethanofuran dehydrogenase subunit E